MIEIDIIIGADWDGNIDWYGLSEQSVATAIKYSNYNEIIDIDHIVSISISLSNNDEVHSLNHQYRGKDKPTNILSFPMLHKDELANINQNIIPEILLGDLILSYQICHNEAQEKNIRLTDHFQHLIIHGILHLLGYNHIEDDDAEKMQSIEIYGLNILGIDNPYEKG